MLGTNYVLLATLLASSTIANGISADTANAKRAANTCTQDEILEVFEAFSQFAKPFCSAFLSKSKSATLPAFASKWSDVPSTISSACSCITSPTPTLGSSSSLIPSPTSNPCSVTAYSGIPAATASCTSITLDNIHVPGNATLDLSKLKPGTTVTFAGLTTFEYADVDINLIAVGGTNITITAEPDAIIDGNGQAWWDGQGSNGGITKPDHFIAVSKVLGTSSIHGLHIRNYPVHCFSISNCVGLEIYNILLDNTAGNAPNNRSDGLPAAHNSDGFDISGSSNMILRDSRVLNQDDCVAVTSGNNITVSNMYCDGSHGLSIGSVGGKSNNNVTNIIFQDSLLINSQNGARIKTNYNTTGYIAGITYRNIALSNISIYGIDIQQDYLNGGPTGIPSNGVIITDITMTNITGTVSQDAKDYYILCGQGSCSDFYFENVHVVGGEGGSCNVQPAGNFVCS